MQAITQQRQWLDATLERLDRQPVDGETTVHAAHRRHPHVAAIFASYGLPRCLDCAVGVDESLEEAAFGEELSLQELLQRINGLLLQLGFPLAG